MSKMILIISFLNFIFYLNKNNNNINNSKNNPNLVSDYFISDFVINSDNTLHNVIYLILMNMTHY